MVSSVKPTTALEKTAVPGSLIALEAMYHVCTGALTARAADSFDLSLMLLPLAHHVGTQRSSAASLMRVNHGSVVVTRL
jgi:hypothetical protein